MPTLNCWRMNIMKNRANLGKLYNDNEIRRVEKSVETLKYFFGEGILCYYLFNAEK